VNDFRGVGKKENSKPIPVTRKALLESIHKEGMAAYIINIKLTKVKRL